MSVELHTARFLLRDLQQADITARYLAWFEDDDARAYITAAARTRSLEDLQSYLEEREGREDVLFLGIFASVDGLHIGNIKYEPVDRSTGSAVMGILIGEVAWRGKGVAGEVLEASAEWLRRYRGITRILLGVAASNAPAVRAYERVGFRVQVPGELTGDSKTNLTMHLEL